jgi:NADPH:quinone reductase-like Zn-dependent oxidoreductase
MKEYILKAGVKGLEALQLQETAPGEPRPFEVRMRVRAVSLNYRDLIIADMGVSRELIPLSDGAGEVEVIGKEVTGLKKGDRVSGLFFPLWQSGEIDARKFAVARGGEPTDGVFAQFVCGPADSFVKIPEHLSFEEAATVPCAGLTAWNALAVHGRLQAGQTLVIQGTGGVALFALQLAKAMGARAILLSSSDSKLARAEEMGADELINYKSHPDWEQLVLEKTSRRGADLILELGGGGTLARSIEAVKIKGRISLVGVLTGFDDKINPLPIMRKCLCVNGIYVGSRAMQEQFQSALAVNRIHPVIDRVFEMQQAREAYEYLRSGRHFGKIVIRPD